MRYALKPRATIYIAESGFKNPFDQAPAMSAGSAHQRGFEASGFEAINQTGQD